MTGLERTVSHSVQHSFWSRVVVMLSFYLRNDLSFGLSFLYFFFLNNLFLDRKLQYLYYYMRNYCNLIGLEQ